ncbi:hypothetical protein [Streptomyces sp. NPDC048636]|uniref:hypothetical protein n=1 Tax=Streptomyces sp. NPDC048636 TaxID=3155762 RepID=UPI003415F199
MNRHETASDPVLTEAQQEAAAQRLIADWVSENTPTATHYKDISPVPSIGDTPPVAQAGRAAMSKRATDISSVMLAAGGTFMMVALGTSVVLLTAERCDPTVVGIVFAAPTTLLGALGLVLKRAKSVVAAAPPVHHHHYEGDVHQDFSTHSSRNAGLIAKTSNVHRPH